MSRSALDCWNEIVEASPEATAIRSPNGTSASRAELQKRSDRLRRHWIKEGLKPREVLAMVLPNGFEWFEAYLACMKLGAIAAPVDPGFSSAEVSEIAKDLRVGGVWDGRRFREGLSDSPYRFRREDISVVKLTSGSTGKAKALFFTDSEMVADARNLIKCMGIREDDTNLGVIPWGHSYGLGSIVYPLLLQGTRVAWTNTAFPSEIAKVCREARCTLFPSVPTVLRALTKSDCVTKDFESLRLTLSAGSKLDPSLAREFKAKFGKGVRNFYGSTETGGICFDRTGEAALTGCSVGEPIEGVSIIEGRSNRFYVASRAVYSYGNRNFTADGLPMVLMADFGGLNSEGKLVLEGRARNVLKIGGRRINPIRMENQLKSIKGVSDALVFSVCRNGEEVLACALESSLSREEIRPFLKEVLAVRDRPKKWIVYERFPVTSRGKTNIAVIKGDVA